MPLWQWAQAQEVLFAVATTASSTLWEKPKSFEDAMIGSATFSAERLLLGADFGGMKGSFRCITDAQGSAATVGIGSPAAIGQAPPAAQTPPRQ